MFLILLEVSTEEASKKSSKEPLPDSPSAEISNTVETATEAPNTDGVNPGKPKEAPSQAPKEQIVDAESPVPRKDASVSGTPSPDSPGPEDSPKEASPVTPSPDALQHQSPDTPDEKPITDSQPAIEAPKLPSPDSPAPEEAPKGPSPAAPALEKAPKLPSPDSPATEEAPKGPSPVAPALGEAPKQLSTDNVALEEAPIEASPESGPVSTPASAVTSEPAKKKGSSKKASKSKDKAKKKSTLLVFLPLYSVNVSRYISIQESTLMHSCSNSYVHVI